MNFCFIVVNKSDLRGLFEKFGLLGRQWASHVKSRITREVFQKHWLGQKLRSRCHFEADELLRVLSRGNFDWNFRFSRAFQSWKLPFLKLWNALKEKRKPRKKIPQYNTRSNSSSLKWHLDCNFWSSQCFGNTSRAMRVFTWEGLFTDEGSNFADNPLKKMIAKYSPS